MLIIAATFTLAQVTTSSISGNVKKAGGDALVGATVKAVHIPTGTTYSTQTRGNGLYNIVNMIPGGPYKVEITFVGFSPFTEENFALPLGENIRIDAELTSTEATLSNVVVTTAAGGSSRRKTGASTSISKEQIASLPTLSRSLSDFTRLTPQANGNSFGGVSNRFNNITIDGAVNNDVFGFPVPVLPAARLLPRQFHWMPSRKYRLYWHLMISPMEILPVAVSMLLPAPVPTMLKVLFIIF